MHQPNIILAQILAHSNISGLIAVGILIGFAISTLLVLLYVAIIRGKQLRLSSRSAAAAANLGNVASRTMMESIPSAVAVYDADGECIHVNTFCRKLFNLDRNRPIVNLMKSSIISESAREKLMRGEDIKETAFLNFTGNTASIFGNTYTQQMVIIYWIKVVRNTQGSITNYVLTIVDITGKYNSQKRNDEQLTLLRGCMSNSGLAAYIYKVDEDRYYKFSNTELVPTQFDTDYVFRHISPLYRSQYLEMFLRVKNGEISSDTRRYPLLSSKENKYYHVETTTAGITDVSGNVTTIVQTMRNVDENQHKLIELEALRLLHSRAMLAQKVYLWRYILADDSLHYSKFDRNIVVTFTEYLNRIHPEDREKYIHLFNKAKIGQTEEIRLTIRKINPDNVFEIYGVPLRDHTGLISEIVGISCDMTEHYNAEDILSQRISKVHAVVSAAKVWIISYDAATDTLSGFSWLNSIERVVRPETFLRFVHPSQHADLLQLHKQLRNKEISHFNLELKMRETLKSDTYYPMELGGEAYDYLNGKPVKYAAFTKFIRQKS